MVDLGKYAVYVLSAYGVSLVLLAAIVGISVLRARQARAELDAVEKRVGRNG